MTALPLLLRQVLAVLGTLLLVLVLLFVLVRVLPGDPVALSLPASASEAEVAAMRAHLAADSLLPVQFAVWLGQMLGGDFGTSVLMRLPVAALLRHALPATLELAGLAMLASAALGLAGGLVLFALRSPVLRSAAESAGTMVTSVPDFLWALAFILVFGVGLDLLPFIGRLDPGVARPGGSGFLLADAVLAGRPGALLSALRHLVLPVAALAVAFAPPVARVLHAALEEAFAQEHIRQARLRGLADGQVWEHALRNALLPTVALMAAQVPFLAGGVVLVEEMFSFPGLGNLLVDAVRNGDLPVIQATGLGFCLLVLLANGALSLAHRALDPRAEAA